MHIYAFGSICRGDIDKDSDIDLLAITEGFNDKLEKTLFSIYSYSRISEIWKEGCPFAWHLATESKLIYTSSGVDFIKYLGEPADYKTMRHDCQKFYQLFLTSMSSLKQETPSFVFEMSNIFLAIRNFAICYLLGNGIKQFSRHAPLRMGIKSLEISAEAYKILERARILSTRGAGNSILWADIHAVLCEEFVIDSWMKKLIKE